MKIVNLLIVACLIVLSACSGEINSFYMTNGDEEITQVTCSMKNVKLRIDVSQLVNYQGGDIRVQFDMMNYTDSQVFGEGTGEMYIRTSDIPEDNLVWVDMSEKTTPVKNALTQKPYNIQHFCNESIPDRTGKCYVRVTY